MVLMLFGWALLLVGTGLGLLGLFFLQGRRSCFLCLFSIFERVASNIEEKVFTPEGVVDSLLSIGTDLEGLVKELNDFCLLALGFSSLFKNFLDQCNRKSFFF